MKNPFLAAVKMNRELHKTGERSCLHIEFDINGSKMRYDTGKGIISTLSAVSFTKLQTVQTPPVQSPNYLWFRQNQFQK